MAEPHRSVILGVLAGCIVFALGIIIGFFSRGESSLSVPEADPEASKMILNGISNVRIEENLRTLAENPHIAGRDVDEKDLVNFVSTSFSDAGLTVEVYPYNVLLSYPDQEDSNYLAVKLSNGTLIDRSNPKEKILDPSQDKPGVVNPFNAYAASGDPEGDLVYVNYGTIEDFIFLAREKAIDLTDKICMARYGAIFRGDKALNAENYNCSGLIIYSDPADYTVEGEGVYPETWYLPGTGAQRGTLFKKAGDPTTIHYPSIDTAWRMAEEKASLPRIPVTPIGYDDAIMYLEKMAGEEVQDGWKGGLNITYRYGPGFQGTHETSKMRMHVTTNNQRATIHNVIGFIRGHVEPDRYVLIGNHRDAWVFGAMDPSSGTAALLEIARSIGQAVKDGWKPRRTMIFCSWGAEEYSLIGSTEWVEEFQKVLGSRSVVYVNMDTIMAGTYSFSAAGSPSLKKVVYDAAKLAPNPNAAEVSAGRTSTYSTWSYTNGGKEPRFNTLGAGSDYSMFLQFLGITCIDIRYTRDPGLGLSSYPVYHSVYETFDLVKTLLDPEFKFHQAVARVAGEMIRIFADTPLLPFDLEDYAQKMTDDANAMLERYGADLAENGMDTSYLISALSNFSTAANSFHKRIENIDMTDQLALRSANDQLMQLERVFIDKEGIEGRDQFSHVIYAPSLHNTYGRAAFPGLVDSMFEIASDSDQAGRWDEVRRQYSILLYHVGSAASTLRDVSPIKGYSNL